MSGGKFYKMLSGYRSPNKMRHGKPSYWDFQKDTIFLAFPYKKEENAPEQVMVTIDNQVLKKNNGREILVTGNFIIPKQKSGGEPFFTEATPEEIREAGAEIDQQGTSGNVVESGELDDTNNGDIGMLDIAGKMNRIKKYAQHYGTGFLFGSVIGLIASKVTHRGLLVSMGLTIGCGIVGAFTSSAIFKAIDKKRNNGQNS